MYTSRESSKCLVRTEGISHISGPVMYTMPCLVIPLGDREPNMHWLFAQPIGIQH